MLDPWLESKGLAGANQVLAYFAVSKLGEPPVDGITDANPEGLTAALGNWAPAVAARLQNGGLTCKVLDKDAFEKQMLEKLIWISAFMLVGARHPGATVGAVEKEYRSEVSSLIAELASAAAAERGLSFDDGMEERLCAYSRAVAHFPTAVKEASPTAANLCNFKWRNGWFYSLTEKALAQGKPDPCPLHTAWLKEIKTIEYRELSAHISSMYAYRSKITLFVAAVSIKRVLPFWGVLDVAYKLIDSEEQAGLTGRDTPEEEQSCCSQRSSLCRRSSHGKLGSRRFGSTETHKSSKEFLSIKIQKVQLMAMVLDAFASYLGDLLRQAAAEELGTMLGVSGEIDKMGDKLRDLKNFLADADRRNITDETVQEWVGELKRAMYEAADIIDLCQLKAMEHGSSSVDAGCFNPLLFCMRNPFHAHEIGTRIKALNQRLDTIKERSAAFNFINLGSYDHHSSNVNASRHGDPSRETSGELDRSGVGGIGKTTLAQKVFNDEAIQGEFSKKIWLSVNQNFNEAELLRRVIIEAGGDAQSAGNAKATLHRSLKGALIGHKTLLVMDDVWNHGAWDGVLKIPLVDVVASGSRVLITTRDEGVARRMTATWPYHHVDALAPDDAWSLLKKQWLVSSIYMVLSSEIDEYHITMLKDIGLKIIQKCGGLPLAVKVMGGLLRRRGESRRDWEQVLDDSKWSITEMPQELSYAVYLSYQDMPPHLKQCFLYYSLLPQNKTYYAHEVVALWISEGFVHGNSNDLEELGINYYKELIYRNLIEPDKLYVNHLSCSMHDVIRSFAQYMIKDEALIVHDGDIDNLTNPHSQKFLRLSIETNHLQSGDIDWKSLQGQKSVRTLISTIQIKMKPSDLLVTFSGLRILHIESVDVAALVEALHLRYVALLNTDISVLPVNFDKMKLLQFLRFDGCINLVNLPDSIVKLGQLRLLDLPSRCTIPRGFRGLTSMRRLHGFRAHMDGDWCSLDELRPLSQLRFLELIHLENVSAASFATNARLGEKIHLIDVFLYCTSKVGDDGLVKEKEGVSEEEQQRIEKVFDELCPPPSVEFIHIDGYFGQLLPSWMMSTSKVSLNNLKFLTFSDLACCKQLPNGLCQLPYLQFFQVARAPCIRRVGTGFLQAVATPFPSLKEMSLRDMVEWEEQHLSYLENFPCVTELTVVRSLDLERITNLPNLQKLTITICPKLKVLGTIPALDRLVLEDYAMETLPEYMRAMGQSGPEWDKFSHVEHVKAYSPDGDNQRKWGPGHLECSLTGGRATVSR
ncbi:Putative disease resistance protein RGA3 [Triticum urartu]|uniref:Putative disease resistance protein RGA3 n=1 Tax=Triticum urartu TaxID=4572 RepID=M7ZY34_TRIUA|nr:Putative disease resistance protein RGA3 [Triticum urartu]